MFCSKCGSELYPNTKVCPNCRFHNININEVTPARVDYYTQTVPLSYPEAYVDGEILVVPRNAVLPASCVKCGGIPKDPWLRKTFYAPSRFWNRGLLWTILRERVQLLVPLCALHRSRRKAEMWTGSVLILSCIPLPVALADLLERYGLRGIPLT